MLCLSFIVAISNTLQKPLEKEQAPIRELETLCTNPSNSHHHGMRFTALSLHGYEHCTFQSLKDLYKETNSWFPNTGYTEFFHMLFRQYISKVFVSLYIHKLFTTFQLPCTSTLRLLYTTLNTAPPSPYIPPIRLLCTSLKTLQLLPVPFYTTRKTFHHLPIPLYTF